VKYIESIKVFIGPPPLEEPDDQGEGPQKEVEVSEVGPQEKSEVVELEEKIQELLSKQKEIVLIVLYSHYFSRTSHRNGKNNRI
jgi:hypothetical protein